MNEQQAESRSHQLVEEVLDDLMAEVRYFRPELGDATGRQSDALIKVQEYRWVNSHLPIGWPVMPKRLVPKMVAYAKKITRRLLRWYINPIIDQQNDMNAAVAEALEELYTAVATLNDRIGERRFEEALDIKSFFKANREEIEQLRRDIKELCHQQTAMMARLQELERRLTNRHSADCTDSYSQL